MLKNDPKECGQCVAETCWPCPEIPGEEPMEPLLKTLLTQCKVEIEQGADGYIVTVWWFDRQDGIAVRAHSARGYSASLYMALFGAWDAYCEEMGQVGSLLIAV